MHSELKLCEFGGSDIRYCRANVFECARISLNLPAKGGGRKHLLTGVNFSASAVRVLHRPQRGGQDDAAQRATNFGLTSADRT